MMIFSVDTLTITRLEEIQRTIEKILSGRNSLLEILHGETELLEEERESLSRLRLADLSLRQSFCKLVGSGNYEAVLRILMQENIPNFVPSFYFGAEETYLSSENGDGPLHLAVMNPDPRMILLLLNIGFSPNAKNRHGKTPFLRLLTSNFRNYYLLKVFREYGADLTIKDDSGKSAVELVLSDYTGNISCIEEIYFLLCQGIDVNEENSETGDNLLHVAVKVGAIQEGFVLIRSGIDLELSNKNIMTPLALAVNLNKVDFVELLISEGAKILPSYEQLIQTYDDEPEKASQSKKIRDMLRTTIKPEKRNNLMSDQLKKLKKNVTQIISEFRSRQTEIEELRGQVSKKNLDRIIGIVDKVCKKEKFSIPIFSLFPPVETCSIMYKLLQELEGESESFMLETILKLGIDGNSKNSDGNTILHLACLQGKYSLILKLLETNLFLVNLTNNLGNSVLHCAVLGRITPSDRLMNVLRKLFEKGASIGMVNRNRKSVLHLAIEESTDSFDGSDVVLYLLQMGADPNICCSENVFPLELAVTKRLTLISDILVNFGAICTGEVVLRAKGDPKFERNFPCPDSIPSTLISASERIRIENKVREWEEMINELEENFNKEKIISTIEIEPSRSCYYFVFNRFQHLTPTQFLFGIGSKQFIDPISVQISDTPHVLYSMTMKPLEKPMKEFSEYSSPESKRRDYCAEKCKEHRLLFVDVYGYEDDFKRYLSTPPNRASVKLGLDVCLHEIGKKSIKLKVKLSQDYNFVHLSRPSGAIKKIFLPDINEILIGPKGIGFQLESSYSKIVNEGLLSASSSVWSSSSNTNLNTNCCLVIRCSSSEICLSFFSESEISQLLVILLYFCPLLKEEGRTQKNKGKLKNFEIKDGPEMISNIFQQFAKGSSVIIQSNLKNFLKQEQGEEPDDSVIQKILDDFGNGTELTKSQFHQFLLSFRNSVENPEELLVQTEKLTGSLPEYFISSSHNTYLEGDQWKSKSTAKRYQECLLEGCRSVELDIWPKEGDPLVPQVLHGHTMTKPVLLQECLKTIRDYSFIVSEFPVILSFEDHCSPQLQDIVAGMCKGIFGEMLWTLPTTTGFQAFPSPEKLKGKILIKGFSIRSTSSNILGTDGSLILDDIVPSLIQNQKNSMSKDLSDITALCTCPFSSFQNYEKTKQPFEMSSFSEDQVVKHSQGSMIKHSSRFMTRSYPKRTRLNSSNYNPFLSWEVGIQMVALNYQTLEKEMMVNYGFFFNNGHTGFRLKPRNFREKLDSIEFDPSKLKDYTSKVEITLIHGIDIPIIQSSKVSLDSASIPRDDNEEKQKKEEKVYLFQVSIYGIQGDLQENRQSLVISTNPLNSKMSLNLSSLKTITFLIKYKPLSMMLFRLFQKKPTKNTYKLLGWYAIPVTSVRPGLRIIPLFHGERPVQFQEDCKLFARITISDFVEDQEAIEIFKNKNSLMEAISMGDFWEVRSLIEKDPKILFSPTTFETMIHIHYACLLGVKDIIQLLLQYGVDPCCCDKNGNNSLHYTINSESSSSKLMEILLVLFNSFQSLNSKERAGSLSSMLTSRTPSRDSGRKPRIVNHVNCPGDLGSFINCKNNQNATPFHYAIKNQGLSPKKYLNLVDLLFKNGANINALTVDNDSPMHFATAAGRSLGVLYLLSQKAVYNAPNSKGLKPLHYAMMLKHYDIVEILMEEEQLKPNLRSIEKTKDEVIKEIFKKIQNSQYQAFYSIEARETFRNWSEYEEKFLSQKTTNKLSSSQGLIVSPKLTYSMLTSRRERSSLGENKNSTLCSAIETGNFLEVKRLLNSKASPNDYCCESEKLTPIVKMLKSWEDNDTGYSILNELLIHGAEIEKPCGPDGFTPLHYCVSFLNSTPALPFLLHNGANVPNPTSAKDKTPLAIAQSNKNLPAIELLSRKYSISPSSSEQKPRSNKITDLDTLYFRWKKSFQERSHSPTLRNRSTESSLNEGEIKEENPRIESVIRVTRGSTYVPRLKNKLIPESRESECGNCSIFQSKLESLGKEIELLEKLSQSGKCLCCSTLKAKVDKLESVYQEVLLSLQFVALTTEVIPFEKEDFQQQQKQTEETRDFASILPKISSRSRRLSSISIKLPPSKSMPCFSSTAPRISQSIPTGKVVLGDSIVEISKILPSIASPGDSMNSKAIMVREDSDDGDGYGEDTEEPWDIIPSGIE